MVESNSLRRLAYVIGNNNYKYLNKLLGTSNDVDMMECTLKKCNFVVQKYKDLKYKSFEKIIYNFKQQRVEYNVALFYFSGHGFEYNGQNYLCPTDSNNNIEQTNINITNLVNDIYQNRNFINIIILDCCRNIYNLKSKSNICIKDISPNFKNMGGTFVAYATSSGESAIEKNNHGIYTQSLCKHLLEENTAIEQVFKAVRKDIIRQSCINELTQIPWEYSSLIDDFYFIKKEEDENISKLVKSAIDNQYSFKKIKEQIKLYFGNENYDYILFEVLNQIDKMAGVKYA